MDFIAHLLWSAIIYSDTFLLPQIFLACFCGVLPDLAAFLPSFFSRSARNRDWRTPEGRQKLLESPQYQQAQKVYNWTHSLVMWGIAIGIGTVIWAIMGGVVANYPWFLFAGVIHIGIDIPTHSKAFFAPAFLTPLSKYRFDGWPWSNKWFMIVNYTSIVVGILWRLFQYQFRRKVIFLP